MQMKLEEINKMELEKTHRRLTKNKEPLGTFNLEDSADVLIGVQSTEKNETIESSVENLSFVPKEYEKQLVKYEAEIR